MDFRDLVSLSKSISENFFKYTKPPTYHILNAQ